MNHLYLSGKCIECCVILTKKPYHIKRIDNLSSMLYQTKRSESHPRILSLRNESRVSSPSCHPEPILRGISSPLCHPERIEGYPRFIGSEKVPSSNSTQKNFCRFRVSWEGVFLPFQLFVTPNEVRSLLL
jgi:hypothetical protein